MDNKQIEIKILTVKNAVATPDFDIDDFSIISVAELNDRDQENSKDLINTGISISAIKLLGRAPHIKDDVSTAIWEAVFCAGANAEEAAVYGKSFI
jgi:hypothetical protein